MLSQQEVREKLIKRSEREKQTYIARQINISSQLLCDFKAGRKDLWQSTLEQLNNYLDS